MTSQSQIKPGDMLVWSRSVYNNASDQVDLVISVKVRTRDTVLLDRSTNPNFMPSDKQIQDELEIYPIEVCIICADGSLLSSWMPHIKRLEDRSWCRIIRGSKIAGTS